MVFSLDPPRTSYSRGTSNTASSMATELRPESSWRLVTPWTGLSRAWILEKVILALMTWNRGISVKNSGSVFHGRSLYGHYTNLNWKP